MKVFLDDERTTPEGWERVYWPDEAVALLKTELVSEISLDHDLGDDARMQVHSANPAARTRMLAGIAAIERAQQP